MHFKPIGSSAVDEYLKRTDCKLRPLERILASLSLSLFPASTRGLNPGQAPPSWSTCTPPIDDHPPSGIPTLSYFLDCHTYLQWFSKAKKIN